MDMRESASANLCPPCFYNMRMCQCLSEVEVENSWGVEVNWRKGVIPSRSALFHQQDRVASPLLWQKRLGMLCLAAQAVSTDKKQVLCSKTCWRNASFKISICWRWPNNVSDRKQMPPAQLRRSEKKRKGKEKRGERRKENKRKKITHMVVQTKTTVQKC